jgi:broad specificity phosphatase PhoE
MKQLTNVVASPQIETEEDVLWQPDTRETHDQIRARGAEFVRWLLRRPERRLAVVSHSSFLFFLLQNYGHHASTTVQGELRRW